MKHFRPGFALLLLAQFAVFWQYANREIVWAYPADFDQSSYLTMDYTLYRGVLRDGLLPALGHYFHEPHPTGLMLPLQDCAAEFLAGPGRMSNLLLNFGYFALLEVVFFVTASWLAGRTAVGWIGVGLLLLLQSPFLAAGGMFDCRIDFIACCLYGTFLCLLIRSDGLRERRWVAAAAGCALLLMSFRFITVTYLLGFCMTLGTLLLGVWLPWRGRAPGAEFVAQSLRRTLVFGAGILALGGVAVAANWKSIHDYYVVGHLTGNERHVRALEMGVSGLAGHLTYYLSSLLHEHLGLVFDVTWLVLAVAGLAAWLGRRPRTGETGPGDPATHGGRWAVPACMVAASLFAPWFILTLDESKSPVVANVLDTPAALLVVLVLARAGRRPARPAGSPAATAPGRSAGPWWAATAALVLILGGINWLTNLTHQGRFSARRTSVEQIGALHDFIGQESARLGFESPVISADMIYDWMVPSTINTALYERTGRWLDARPALGVGIFALTREEVFAKLGRSDFALVSTYPKEGPYPFYDSVRPLAGEIRAWCEAHLMRLRVFRIDSGEVTVYVRPEVALEGLSGEWITPAGVRLRLPSEELGQLRASGKTALVLEGADNLTALPQPPVASARLEGPGGEPGNVDCPAGYTRPAPGTYRIRIDLGAVPPGADAVVDLRLDGAFFVPKEVGINDDTRHLIVTRPTVTRFE